jgi:membrane protein implicated in regulation of membrane protease activity
MTVLTVGLVILGGALALATVAMLALIALREARSISRRQVQSGAEGLIGHVGIVHRTIDPMGDVAVDGELWRARRAWATEGEPPPAEGDQVVVDSVHGLTLLVRRADEWEVEL